MDRGRRAEPYSNATIWTREVARNLAGHLARVNKAHSCVDTKSPKSTRLPKFQHAQKRCPTSPMTTRQPLLAIPRNSSATGEHELDYRGVSGGSAREEAEGTSRSMNNQRSAPCRVEDRRYDLIKANAAGAPLELQNNSTNRTGEANQEIQDRPVRVPAAKALMKQHPHDINGGTLGDMVYNCPPILPHQKKRSAHDFYKRQEQQKIWQENQALIKRLQSTKATLNSKEWKKDEKWTQEFLKTQERRRSALQHELQKAQVSPHALLRPKPLKSLHPKTAIHESHPEKNEDAACSTTLGAPQSTRQKLKVLVLPKSRELSSLPASASNHRRITKLRNQKPSSRSSGDLVDVGSTEETKNDATDAAVESNQAAFIPDNGIVNVRFTFSRGRSRGSGVRTTDVEQSDQPQSLEVDESERDQMSLSGAFSPGVDLESALNAVAVDETEFLDPSSPGQLSDASSSDKIAVGANSFSLHNGVKENVPDDAPAVVNAPENGFASLTEERRSPQPTEEDPAQRVSEDDEEEAYDEENFDDDPDMDHNSAPPEQKGEASGYWSEFEEEPAVSAIPQATIVTENQEQGEDAEEESYSNDDFVE